MKNIRPGKIYITQKDHDSLLVFLSSVEIMDAETERIYLRHGVVEQICQTDKPKLFSGPGTEDDYIQSFLVKMDRYRFDNLSYALPVKQARLIERL